QNLEEFKKELEQLDKEKAEADNLTPVERREKNMELAKKSAELDEQAAALLNKHKEFLEKGLPLIDTNDALGKAALKNFMESRHNVNKGETDKGYLCTKDMYAFEHMESVKVQDLTKIIKTALGVRDNKTLPDEEEKENDWESIENNWEALEDWMDKTLRQFELDDGEGGEIHA